MQPKEFKHIMKREGRYHCYCGGIETKKDRLSCHHIIPIRDGGKLVLWNCALIARKNHDKFNLIERKLPLIAEYMNNSFLEYIHTGNYAIVKENKRILQKYYPRAKQLVKRRK